MIDRLRFLLDRPLDPLAARAVVVVATAILLGFAGLFLLGARGASRPATDGHPAVQSRPALPIVAPQVEASSPEAPSASRRRRQDPQDEQGTPAATRVAKAMRSHRALQHVPYRGRRLSVRLVGARGARAVLLVSAPTISAARRGWRRFLRRYRDRGRAYLPRFKAASAAGGGG